MTPAEAVEYVKTKIEIKNPALRGLMVKAEICPQYGVRLVATHSSPARDDGKVQTFYTMEVVGDVDYMSESHLESVVTNFVRGVFVHEFGECFHVNGIRKRDPHSREGSRIAA